MVARKFSDEQEAWIKARNFLTLQDLANQINAHFHRTDITRHWVGQFRRRHKMTGTRGVKGDRPKYGPGERKNGDGYMRVMVDGKDVPKHRVEWERVNGPIPQGSSLVCLGERHDTLPGNWVLVSNDVRGYLDKGSRRLANLPPDLHKTAIAIAKLRSKLGLKSCGEKTRQRQARATKGAS